MKILYRATILVALLLVSEDALGSPEEGCIHFHVEGMPHTPIYLGGQYSVSVRGDATFWGEYEFGSKNVRFNGNMSEIDDTISNPLRTKTAELKKLVDDLNDNGISISLNGATTCADRCRTRLALPAWRDSSEIERDQLIDATRTSLKKSARSGKHHAKKWILDSQAYNSRQLRELILSSFHDFDLGEKTRFPNEQNFNKKLIRLQHEGTIIQQDGTITCLEAVIHQLANFAKMSPVSVYRLDFVGGPRNGQTYIGLTQMLLTERLKSHIANATRPGAEQRNPLSRIYPAIRETLTFANESNIDICRFIKISSLDEGIRADTEEPRRKEEYFYQQALKLHGKDKVLNVAKTGSFGGRSGTTEVVFLGKMYYFAQACRKACTYYQISNDDTESYINRLKSFYYNKDHPMSFSDAAEKAITPKGRSRAIRRDSVLYDLDGTLVTLEQAAENLGKHRDWLHAKLRRAKVLGIQGVKIRDILNGYIKSPPEKTPKVTHFLAKAPPHFLQLVSSETSWKGLHRLLDIADSTLKEWGRRFEHSPETFWGKVAERKNIKLS